MDIIVSGAFSNPISPHAIGPYSVCERKTDVPG
jgi:hypothetical protein